MSPSLGEFRIRRCGKGDLERILAVINDGARGYRGYVSPRHLGHPYMEEDELRRELEAGVSFWGYEEGNTLRGVMGKQRRGGVMLIRHAYVRQADQRRGIGTRLLNRLRADARTPLLVGTWAEAEGALRFYQARGFRLLPREESERLLRRYWDIPERQIQASVVLADAAWLPEGEGAAGTATQ